MIATASSVLLEQADLPRKYLHNLGDVGQGHLSMLVSIMGFMKILIMMMSFLRLHVINQQ